MLQRLNTSQIVSVVGPSGCGKSSLVKVGIIPVLSAGLLTRAGHDWMTIEMRPGQDPLGNLAGALAKLSCVADGAPAFEAGQIEAVLAAERSALWVVMDRVADLLKGSEPIHQPAAGPSAPRPVRGCFSGVHDSRAVDQFVALISEFFAAPIRSFTSCSPCAPISSASAPTFPASPILNTTPYITPVLRGQDLADVIVRPAETYWGEVEPALVTAIVRDMGAGTSYDADPLPLMQHALLWMWQQAWPATGLAEPPNPGMSLPDGTPKAGLTLALYREHGGLHGILNRHADAILGRIAGARRRTASGDRRGHVPPPE